MVVKSLKAEPWPIPRLAEFNAPAPFSVANEYTQPVTLLQRFINAVESSVEKCELRMEEVSDIYDQTLIKNRFRSLFVRSFAMFLFESVSMGSNN